MAKKGKTNKTASKRIKFSNPKGNKPPKIKVCKGKHHNMTKKTSRAKSRANQKKTDEITDGYKKAFIKKVKNIN